MVIVARLIINIAKINNTIFDTEKICNILVEFELLSSEELVFIELYVLSSVKTYTTYLFIYCNE